MQTPKATLESRNPKILNSKPRQSQTQKPLTEALVEPILIAELPEP